MRYIFIFLIFQTILLPITLSAQSDTIYVDENDQYISKTIFYKKARSSIYNRVRFSTDTLVLEKLRFKYFFGNLSPIIKTQFFQLLKKRNQIDTTKTLIIHYQDTLKKESEFPKRSFINYINGVKCYNISYKDFISTNKKTVEYYKRYGKRLTSLNFYFHNNGHPEVYKNLRWYKDYGGLIKKIFDFLSNSLKIVIIHPDGEFYIESTETKLPYTDLFLKKNWFEHKNKFIDEVDVLNNYE